MENDVDDWKFVAVNDGETNIVEGTADVETCQIGHISRALRSHRKHGYEAIVLLKLEQYLRRKGCKQVQTMTPPPNIADEVDGDFYLAHGWRHRYSWWERTFFCAYEREFVKDLN